MSFILKIVLHVRHENAITHCKIDYNTNLFVYMMASDLISNHSIYMVCNINE